MPALPLLKTLRPDLLEQHENTSLLRFIVCGSVDHGKSTLIGRLLYEAGVLFEDQLTALDQDSRRHDTEGVGRDFSLLLDGLAAEREQKITIDVAYRFFATARRKFIVADAPGHEQYTRNMATGASTADVALLLVSASEGLTRQTRRHALIASMLGVRRFVVVINKMDLIGWSQLKFRALETEAKLLAAEIGINEIVVVPVAARSGDNVVTRSGRMDWYSGATLLEYLEQVETGSRPGLAALRMPIQLVNRPNSNFRGYSGLIVGGEVRPGMDVRIVPFGNTTRIDRIVTPDGDLRCAIAGQSVTLTFADEIDASRGDVVVEAAAPFGVADRVSARFVWFDEEPLAPDRPYLLKLGAATVRAMIEPDLHVVDLDSFNAARAERLQGNEIGTGFVQLDRPVAVDRYVDNAATGSFILIDPESCNTVGIGMIEAVHADQRDAGIKTTFREVIRATESHGRSIAKAISWRATGSLDTFLVAMLVTGNANIAGSVAVAEILTKMFIYYLHERAWALIPWGRSAASSARGISSGRVIRPSPTQTPTSCRKPTLASSRRALVAATMALAAAIIVPGEKGIASSASAPAKTHQGEADEHVRRIDAAASLLHAGSTRDDVERILGKPTLATDLGGQQGGDAALTYAGGPIRTHVVLTAGTVTAVMLDIVYFDQAQLPQRARVIKPTMLRDGVTELLGSPSSDQHWNEVGFVMEQMTFNPVGEPEFSVFLVDGLVVDVRPDHEKPQDLASMQLPAGVPDNVVGNQLAIGLTPDQATPFLGKLESNIHFALKGQPVDYANYHERNGNGLVTVTFIGGILTAFKQWPADQL
jgi:sulfate adenylyltransferase large subunit